MVSTPDPPPTDIDDPQDAPPAEETTDADVVASLQDENQRLWDRIEQMKAARDEAADTAQQLAEAVEANDDLRKRYTEFALAESVRQAAEAVGMPRELAAVYTHRFTCRLNEAGQVHVEPNPTEFLLKELKSDPLLQQSVARARQEKNAAAVVHGADDVDEADPVELMTVLDRNPGKKARFIGRHGTDAFVGLAERARRKGYRG